MNDAPDATCRAFAERLLQETYESLDDERDALFSIAVDVARTAIDPRDPDYSRPGIFAHHNCSRCKDGADLSRCPTPDSPGNCGYPHARND